jgi:hypothetical protein
LRLRNIDIEAGSIEAVRRAAAADPGHRAAASPELSIGGSTPIPPSCQSRPTEPNGAAPVS